jgi:GT2 family glycosyltransferase/uncharacterized membrane protein YqaE (UPF0057 family)
MKDPFPPTYDVRPLTDELAKNGYADPGSGAMRIRDKPALEIDQAALLPERDTKGMPEANLNLQISVVVPTCGRAELLNRCLAALVSQEFDPDRYEIIIVDDSPSAATKKIVEMWACRMSDRGLAVVYIPNHGPHGPAAARNRGWQAARSDIIAFTDDDTVPTAQWLKLGLEAFGESRDEADAIWGSIEMPLSTAPTDYERDAKHLETAEFVTANCMCRRPILMEVGGFDERFRFAWREDSDFYFNLLDHNARIRHVPSAVVIHPVRPAPWGVSISQQKKILFDALLYKKHPQRYRQKIRATPRWDYYLIVLSLLVAPIAALAGAGMLATISGAIWLGMTAWLFAKRMQGTTKTFSHVAEMLLTSILIPPLAVYWRMVGALRFRVAFL